MGKFWEYISHLQRLKGIYENDFNITNNELEEKIKFLKCHIERKKVSAINLDEIKEFCEGEWKKVIKKAISALFKKIESRKTRGSEFAEIKFQLNKLKEDIAIYEYDVNKYDNVYEYDLKGYREQIKEKINIEQFNEKRFWIGMLIGFILGIITSAIFWALQTGLT